MRLDPNFVAQQVGDEVLLVPVGTASENFHGLVRLNESAAFITEQLAEDTTRDDLIKALEAEYEGTREQFALSVDRTVEVLREAGAIID